MNQEMNLHQAFNVEIDNEYIVTSDLYTDHVSTNVNDVFCRHVMILYLNILQTMQLYILRSIQIQWTSLFRERNCFLSILYVC